MEGRSLRHLSSIELSREALHHNVATLRALHPTVQAFAVVKANAYGHGLEEIVALLTHEGGFAAHGVNGFQVDDLEELRQVRRVTDASVDLYGYVQIEDLAEASLSGGVTFGLYDPSHLAELDRVRRLHNVNPLFDIKIDALLGRQGLLPSDVDEFLDELVKYTGLKPSCVYAHYANIEDTTDLTHAEAQEAAFAEAERKVIERYPHVGRHIFATSGLLTRDGRLSDKVRLGIGLYGLYPSAPLARSHAHLDLRPVMRWVTHLAQVKTLPAGHPVGYGLTYRTARPTMIGIVPQGYSDGYDRGLSNVGEVLVHGRRCPVIGRIAMNMFAVDLTPAPDARAEDEVVLLGAQGDDRITAEEIAAKLGTINYEVVARVSPLLPRVVV